MVVCDACLNKASVVGVRWGKEEWSLGDFSVDFGEDVWERGSALLVIEVKLLVEWKMVAAM